MKPRVSIIMPIYNPDQKFLTNAIDSLLRQRCDRKKFEVHFRDDGSTDNSPEFMKDQMERCPPEFHYTRREVNLGQSVTRNEAIEMSEGKYIILFDADDVLHPDAIGKTINFMEAHPNVEYSYSKHVWIDSEGKVIAMRQGVPYSQKELLHRNIIGHIKCFSRKIHQRIGGFDSEMLFGQDYDHALRASELLGENGIKQNPQHLYFYRLHPESVSHTKRELRREQVSGAIKRSLGRRGINTEVRFSHMTQDKFNYFEWSAR